ncbi:MAG: SDR family oxidoreductase [Hyphomicrobiales bacterium]
MGRLEGKRAIVTGGTTGIGAATAKRFLEEDAKVVVWGRNPENVKKIAASLPALADAVACDVADAAQVDQAFARSLEKLGGLDTMICNAGISIREKFLDIRREDFDRTMKVNVYGVFYPGQLAARHMMANGGGSIQITASTAANLAYRRYGDYNASKAALLGLMRSMALELAPKVRVNAVNPGYTMTPMQEAEYSPEMVGQVNSVIPAGRHARPEEIAGMFVYLASDEAAYVTGASLTIDGAESVASPAATLP